METVEIVIKIEKNTFDAIGILQAYVDDKHIINGYQMKGNSTFGSMINAIANGTVLPKGHGTLKDTDAICKDIISALGIRDEKYLLEAEKAVYKRIKNANAIIEADKAESEE